jgi:NhaP-type Na+/H+ or K+/H+ antiporter
MLDLVSLFGLVGVVLTVSALTSGLVERAPLSFPILFMSLGFVLGGRGLGLLHVSPHDPLLEAVAIISLAFVLFLDAVKMQPSEFRKGGLVPMLVLGPGTLLTIAGIAGISALLLHTNLLASLLLGAILASTDPVVLRDVLRNPKIPRSVRQTLSIEAGTNDLVVLPIVLVLIALARGQGGGVSYWLTFLGQVFLLGPVIGFAVGGAGAWLMSRIDARMGIRREHQALFGVGLVLVAYTAAVAAGGDGFLAAFAAGFAVVVLDLELCDCFLEYGETTVEMAMLLAFVLFGAALSMMLDTIPFWPTLALALGALVGVRPLAIGLVLHRTALSPSGRAFVGWFGPRGLSSLLLVLLAVQGHVPGAERLMAITGAVAIVSVILHGITATPLSHWYVARVASEVLPEERESTAAGVFGNGGSPPAVIQADELHERLQGATPPVVLDVRGRSAYFGEQIPGSIHVLPDQIVQWAEGKPRSQEVVTYCTCPGEGTSGRAVRQLEKLGFTARALERGLDAWREHYPVEPTTG